MITTTRKALIVGAALALLGAKPVKAASIRTPPMQPGAEQKLVCTSVNLRVKSLQMQAQIVDRFGDNVTDFARTDWNPEETTVVTLRVESSNPNARYCRVTITDGRKHDVAASLQACSFDEATCSSALAAK